MAMTLSDLNSSLAKAINTGDFGQACAYCAERVSRWPEDFKARELLAMIIGNAGNPLAAIDILKATAEALLHRGYLLAAIGCIKKGMEQAPSDQHWRDVLLRLHVKATYHQVGKVKTPPPLPPEHKDGALAVTADELLALDVKARVQKAYEIGKTFAHVNEIVKPAPLPLFSELSSESFGALVQHSNYRRLKGQEAFITEGTPGDALYVVVSGEVEVTRQGKPLAKLASGAVVGEMALLTDELRTATVKATQECELFEVKRDLLDRLTAEAPRIREDLLNFCRNRLLDNIVRSSVLFRRFDDAGRAQLLKLFLRKAYKPGEVILKESQAGIGLFLIAAGQVKVEATNEAGQVLELAQLSVGNVFGEISLLKERPVTATVVAVKQTGVLFLPRELFQQLLAQYPEIREELESLGDERLKATEAAKEIEDLSDFVLV